MCGEGTSIGVIFFPELTTFFEIFSHKKEQYRNSFLVGFRSSSCSPSIHFLKYCSIPSQLYSVPSQLYQFRLSCTQFRLSCISSVSAVLSSVSAVSVPSQLYPVPSQLYSVPSQLYQFRLSCNSSVSAVPEEGYHPTSTSAAEVEY